MYKLATSLPRLPATLTEERTATVNTNGTNVGLQDVRICRRDDAMHPMLGVIPQAPRLQVEAPEVGHWALSSAAQGPKSLPLQNTCAARPFLPRRAPQCSPDLLMLGAASGRRLYHICRNLRRGSSAARPRPRCGLAALRAPGRAAAAAPSAAPAPGLRRAVPTQKQSKIKAFKIKANLWNF